MKLNKFKTVLSVGVLSLLVLAGLSQTAAAQHNSQWAHEKNRVRKEQKQHEKALKRREKCYRVYREGNYYQTDYRGAELLCKAVRDGYAQGYRQGQINRVRAVEQTLKKPLAAILICGNMICRKRIKGGAQWKCI